jgi:hypothetical protein
MSLYRSLWVLGSKIPFKTIRTIVMFICQAYYFYFNIVGMFSLFAMFIQIDFLIIRTFADILVSFFTTRKFIETKEYNPDKYNKWFEKSN